MTDVTPDYIICENPQATKEQIDEWQEMLRELEEREHE